MNNLSDKFWYDDISIIIRSDRLSEFFPTAEQSLEERFNSIVRLSLYISIILYYYHKNVRWFSIFIGSLLFTFYIYSNFKQDNREGEKRNESGIESVTVKEGLENDKCTKPVLDNPFMNVTMKDYLNIDEKTGKVVDRPKACNITNGDVKKSMDEMFNNNLYKDVNDIFGKMNSQRQFYTMPSTTIPNAQDDFARWLYLNPKTCKEDQEFCLRYEDIRGKRPVFVNPLQNPVETKGDNKNEI